MDAYEMKTLMDQLGGAFEKFKSEHAAALAAEQKRVDQIEKRLMRPGGSVSTFDPPANVDRKAFNAALRSFAKSNDPSAFAEFTDAETKAMSIGSDPDGGYMVPPVLSPNVMRRVRESVALYRLANVMEVPAGSDALEFLRENGDLSASWVGETDSRPETNSPTFTKTRVSLREIYTMPAVTQQLVDLASFDLAAYLTDAISRRIIRAEGAAFMTGEGVSRPRGLLAYPTAATADAARPFGTIEHVNTGANGGFTTTVSGTSNPADVLIDLTIKLAPEYSSNARWIMSRDVANLVRKFKLSDGQFILQPGLQMGQPPMLLGYPVEIDDFMPALGTGSLSLAFGDFQRAYTIVERAGIRMLADPYTAKPFVRFYARRLVGGGLVDSDAVKLLRFAA